MTPPAGPGPVACAHPLDEMLLLDYWIGTVSPEQEEAVDAHLLACDACGHRLREIVALADALRSIARSGALRVVVSDDYVQRAIAEGRRVRDYAPPSGGSIQCTVSADDDLLVARLTADLRGAERIDISFCSLDGVERQRLIDIPVHDEAGVIYQESIAFAKASPTSSMMTRLLAVSDDGSERLIGEYTFHHTRTIPD